MKALLDTTIVLDLLMDRAPFVDAAVELFSLIEQGAITGYLCGTSVTTVFYLASKVVGPGKAEEEVRKLLSLFEIAPVNRQVLESALAADFSDFEDAVIYEAGRYAGAEAIVTRNKKDFKKSRIPVYSSQEMVLLLAARGR